MLRTTYFAAVLALLVGSAWAAGDIIDRPKNGPTKSGQFLLMMVQR